MDPTAVAAFYQGKGYTVREGARVPGLSGNEHKVPLLAEGPLGSLAIFFGDFGGVDGPEMGGARKAARDIGATPVLAADEFSNNDRQVAARLGVVLLDGTMMMEDPPAGPAAPPQAAWPGLQVRSSSTTHAKTEPDQHPWPASGRVGGRDGPAARAIDIDDLLAETRPARPDTKAEMVEEAMEEAEGLPADAPATAVTTATADLDDGETLWRRPRSTPASSTPTAKRAGPGTKFAWLQADAGPGERKRGTGGSGSKDGGFAIDYDDVVPARSRSDDGAGPVTGPVRGERLGDAPDLQPTIEQLERRERRNRLQRRIFWVLFAFVFLYLFYLWWT